MTNCSFYRKSVMAVGGMALVIFLSSQASAQTYYGALTIGDHSSTYSITTDGTLGAINRDNIISFSVMLSTSAGVESFSSATGGVVSSNGSALSATSTDLLFDYELFAPYNFLLLCSFIATCGATTYIQFENNGGIDYDSMRFNSGAIVDTPRRGVRSIASVPGTNSAVPEPGTWAMMLLGFGAIGYSMRRRRRMGPILRT